MRLADVEISLADLAAQRRLIALTREAKYEVAPLLALAEAFAESCDEAEGVPAPDLGCAFVASALVDLASWGARVSFRGSALQVHWPPALQEPTDENRARLRAALQRLRGAASNYDAPVAEEEALSLLASGQVRLCPVEDSPELLAAWRSGITTWSMPYRTREGRSRRFVLTIDAGGPPVPMGLLEIGDDAPHNPTRDLALGLTAGQALSAVGSDALQDRLRSLRHALSPEGLPISPRSGLDALASHLEGITTAGRGRQGDHGEVSRKKRLTYLARLTKAELALRGRGGSEAEVAEGIRAIHDLAIPRINVEMTICGALPPFNRLLGGKAVASMAAHPFVRSFVDRPFGVIARSLFDASTLSDLFPSNGALSVTTKGLFPQHSAQYTGVTIPGATGGLRLEKIGDTLGQTTSQLSDRTMRLAVRTLDGVDNRMVSRVYGSGGGKRQRTLQQAALHLGLPARFVYAAISRPVYEVQLASNIPMIVFANEEPKWLASAYEPDLDPRAYESAALHLWRERWLPVAARRLRSVEHPA